MVEGVLTYELEIAW